MRMIQRRDKSMCLRVDLAENFSTFHTGVERGTYVLLNLNPRRAGIGVSQPSPPYERDSTQRQEVEFAR
jgi:hypothetical protein